MYFPCNVMYCPGNVQFHSFSNFLILFHNSTKYPSLCHTRTTPCLTVRTCPASSGSSSSGCLSYRESVRSYILMNCFHSSSSSTSTFSFCSRSCSSFSQLLLFSGGKYFSVNLISCIILNLCIESYE